MGETIIDGFSGAGFSARVYNDGSLGSHLVNEYFLDIAKGVVPGHSREFKTGRHPGIGLAEEVIWDGEGNYVFLTTAEQINIVSTDVNDTLLGTGGRTLQIIGLDENFDQLTEIVNLNGLTNVLTTNSFLRVNRMIVLTSGTNTPIGDSNLGDITAITNTTATLQAKILIGNGQTLMAIFTVPAGKSAFLTGISFGLSEGKSCLFKAKVRNGPGPPFSFSVKFAQDVFETTTSINLSLPFPAPEKSDIAMTGKSSASGTAAGVSFSIILIDNEFII